MQACTGGSGVRRGDARAFAQRHVARQRSGGGDPALAVQVGNAALFQAGLQFQQAGIVFGGPIAAVQQTGQDGGQAGVGTGAVQCLGVGQVQRRRGGQVGALALPQGHGLFGLANVEPGIGHLAYGIGVLVDQVFRLGQQCLALPGIGLGQGLGDQHLPPGFLQQQGLRR